jgi:hypothetical protein
VAKGSSASYDTLVDLLESTERFLRRLDMCTQIPRTPALDEAVVKIMVELLSTLALVTKELRQGKSSESVLVDMFLCSIQCSEIRQEAFRREGRRGSTSEARLTHTRRGSGDLGGGSTSRLRSRPEYECSHGGWGTRALCSSPFVQHHFL